MEQFKKQLAAFGWPRIIIFLFLLSLFIARRYRRLARRNDCDGVELSRMGRLFFGYGVYHSDLCGYRLCLR